MAISVNGVLFDELTSDPGSPIEGQVWFNTTEHLFKIYRNGGVSSFVDAATLLAHTGSTSNPHATTLEQARTAGATLAGAINFGGYALTNVGTGTLTTDAAQRGWVNEQINAKIAGADWQESVLDRLTTPPGSPNDGDRYIIIATATGDWAGKENQIAEYDGTGLAWVYGIPNEGWTTRVESENLIYTFDGSAWGNIGGAVDHNQLVNLTSGDPHTQYQKESEKDAASGYCGLEADSTIGNTRHGNRGGGSLHAVVSASGAGFLPQSKLDATVNPTVNDDGTQGYIPGSRWLNLTGMTEWIMISNATGAAVWKETTNAASVLSHKAGRVLAASFAGNPKKATVTFATPFADANYSVVITPVINGNAHYSPNIESQLAGSFVIDIGSNTVSQLIHVGWHATKDGESA